MTLKTTLIDADALAALPPADALIVDCRFDLADPGKGRREFLDGHIPAALYASLDGDLSDLTRQAEGMGRIRCRWPRPSARCCRAGAGGPACRW
jgi:Rhodanese-related sulfurtransferase